MKSCIMLLLWGYFLLVTFLLAGPLKTTPPSHGCDSGSSQKVTQLLSAALKQCSRGEKKKHFSLKCCVLHCRLRARSPVRGKRPAGNLKASPGLFCLLHILQHACFVFFFSQTHQRRWDEAPQRAPLRRHLRQAEADRPEAAGGGEALLEKGIFTWICLC